MDQFHLWYWVFPASHVRLLDWQIKEEEENIRAIIDTDNDKYAAELIAENEKKKKK